MTKRRKYQSSWATCPFYHNEYPTEIVCEGVEDGCLIHLSFHDPAAKKQYETARCYSSYRECRIAQMLEQKYMEE